MKGDKFDPKGLIFEAYRIDGITKSECRTIFLDWALSIPIAADQKSMIQVLLDRYETDGHPMSEVLNEGLASISAPKRRGGWRSRNRPQTDLN
jgi:hypothetical protein